MAQQLIDLKWLRFKKIDRELEKADAMFTELYGRVDALEGAAGGDYTLVVGPTAAYQTIGAAVAAAGSGDVVRVQPGGVYTEDVVLPAGVSLQAEGADLIGSIEIAAGSFVSLNRHYAGAGTDMLQRSGNTGHSFYRANIMDGRGLAGALAGKRCIRNTSNGGVLFIEVGVLFVSASGVGVSDGGGSGVGHIHFWTPDLYLAGDSAVGIQAAANSNFIGYIDHILEIGSPSSTVGIQITSVSGVVKATVTEVVADTAASVAGGTLHLTASKIDGTVARSNAGTIYVVSPHHNGSLSETGTGSTNGLLGGSLHNVT